MLLRFFSSYRVASSSLGVKAFALSSCILLCHVLLSFLGGRPALFWGETQGEWIWGRGKVGSAGKSGERGDVVGTYYIKE